MIAAVVIVAAIVFFTWVILNVFKKQHGATGALPVLVNELKGE